MNVRVLAALLLALLFGWAQLRFSAPGDSGAAGAPGTAARAVTVVGSLLPAIVRADDNNDDGDDNSETDDNSDSADNSDDADNSDSADNSGDVDNSDDDTANGNSDDSSDNGNGNDNRNENDDGDDAGNGNGNGNDNLEVLQPGTPTSEPEEGGEPVEQPVIPTPLPTLGISLTDPRGIPEGSVDDVEDDDGSETEASDTSAGGVMEVALGKRIVVRALPSLPRGITITLRRVDPGALDPVPGQLAGDLLFTVEAHDAAGRPLASLPAEVNLNVRYRDVDADGLDEERLEIVHLDPQARQWLPAPNAIRDVPGRFLAASITELGAYAVHTP